MQAEKASGCTLSFEVPQSRAPQARLRVPQQYSSQQLQQPLMSAVQLGEKRMERNGEVPGRGHERRACSGVTLEMVVPTRPVQHQSGAAGGREPSVGLPRGGLAGREPAGACRAEYSQITYGEVGCRDRSGPPKIEEGRGPGAT